MDDKVDLETNDVALDMFKPCITCSTFKAGINEVLINKLVFLMVEEDGTTWCYRAVPCGWSDAAACPPFNYHSTWEHSLRCEPSFRLSYWSVSDGLSAPYYMSTPFQDSQHPLLL